jgi:hypothetical protein
MINLDTKVLLFRLLCREDFSKNGLTFKDLRHVKQAIQERQEFEKLLIYPQISTPDLNSAIELHSKYFSWHGNKIVRSPNSEEVYSERNRCMVQFNSDEVPQNIAETVYDVLNNLSVGSSV